jgi:putative oxidoreductase
MSIAILITFLARLSLVLLFLPFSALDKLLNFRLATAQASKAAPNRSVARGLIVAGFLVEVVMSLGVLTGIADRFAAFILAGYCAVTALLWKQFWRQPDFRLTGQSAGREVFWDFLKNFAVAGGFLMLALGPNAGSVSRFLQAPFASTHPYAMHRTGAEQ